MRLLTAHRILIGTFVAFGLFLAARSAVRWRGSGDPADLTVALVSVAVAAGFALYLRSLRGRPP